VNRWHTIACCVLLLSAQYATAQIQQRTEADPVGQLLREAGQLISAERLDEAEAVLRRAAELEPRALDVGFTIGTLLIKQQRYALAVRMMERLLQAHPDSFAVMNNLSWLYATATDPTVRNGERAVELAQQALLKQPNSFHVWNTLSEGHYIIGNYERAQRAAEEALRLAQRAGADIERIVNYRRQAEKCRSALLASSLLN
jgi:tetratricopeptide (TPR) repeat protein